MFGFLLGFLAVMALAMVFCRRGILKKSQVAALALALLYLGIVFASTVFTRVPAAEAKYELELFWSWRKAFLEHNRQALLEILLNGILLLPLGALSPVVFGRRIGAVKGFLFGFAVSAVIEVCQLVFHRGLFEWDDMIHNAFGCMIGCVMTDLFLKILDGIRGKRRPFFREK